MVKLSRVSKLDGIQSWSLQAVETCPGSRRDDGSLVGVCQGCYATEGNYRFPNVKRVRDHNRDDWKRDDWVDRMVAALSTERYFRWFDSGDVYDYRLAIKIYDVVRRTYWCKHWIPTRSHKITHIRIALEMINRLPNAVVRYSADEVDEFDPQRHGSMVTSDPDVLPQGVKLCEAAQNTPKQCNGCRACWDKSVPAVAYVAHGRRMHKMLGEREFPLPDVA